MQRRKEKKRSRIRLIPIIFTLFIGALGSYYTNSFKGGLATIILFLIFVLFLIIWWKTRSFRRLRKAGIKQIDEMSGEEFERYLGALFKKRGFKVSYTKSSSDYGADLILEDREDIIAVQAKRYSGSVGVKAVQEIIGALKMYDATEAWVVTNSYFTKQAEKLADSNDVYLVDRDELIQLILESK